MGLSDQPEELTRVEVKLLVFPYVVKLPNSHEDAPHHASDSKISADTPSPRAGLFQEVPPEVLRRVGWGRGYGPEVLMNPERFISLQAQRNLMQTGKINMSNLNSD